MLRIFGKGGRLGLNLKRGLASSTASSTAVCDVSRRGDVAVITLKHPPLNALSHSLRVQVVESIKRACDDTDVRSVVILGDGKAFCAGADITEFQTGAFLKEPRIAELTRVLEDCSKPVIAAIQGVALGGGLELALGAHYRIAHKHASLGFPEVHLGILPGATGTQRLPRVTDVKDAIDIISSGTPMSAKVALQKGIIDKVIENDLLTEAVKFAQEVANKPLDARRVSQMSVKGKEQGPAVFEEALKKVAQRARGAISPVFALKAVQAAAEAASYSEGLDKEAEYGRLLFISSESRAQQYAFFSERKIAKWNVPNTDISYKTAKPVPVNSGAVIGGGTMGSGIALNFITNGIPVFLVEQNQEILDKAVAMISGLVKRDVKLGRISEAKGQERLSLLKPTMDYEQLKDTDIVIEAVFENLAIKKEIFERLDKVCKPETILTSNTSGLDIDQMAAATSRPDKVMGTHFFSPAHIMKLLENVRGERTSAETMATAMELGKRLKKISVLVGNCPHFVGNRMLAPYSIEAILCVEEGALPHDVDQVLLDFGFPMGLMRMGDMAGLDIGYKSKTDFGYITAEGQEDRFRKGRRYCPLGDMLVEKGRLGQKSGKGWYVYDKPGGKEAKVDPEVTEMITDYCKRHNIQRRRLPPQEIHERCLFPLLNEGFKILEEGMASSEEDIDMIWLYGYGWPRHTGGPIHYAKNFVGLRRLYERLLYYQGLDPESPHWKPSQLLEDMTYGSEGLLG